MVYSDPMRSVDVRRTIIKRKARDCIHLDIDLPFNVPPGPDCCGSVGCPPAREKGR